MTLRELAAATGASLRGSGDIPISGITHRAQAVHAGWVFAAFPGQRHHGLEFLDVACAQGAAAVLSDRDPGPRLPWLASDTPRRAAALAAWALAGHPEERLRIAAVTGTNGKSTVVDLIGTIARTSGAATGTFGTLAYTLPHRTVEAPRTTPEATELAPLLAELVAQGGTLAALEASSHALALDRIAGLPVDVAVWTNLTRDHLDFHHTPDEYFAAKRRLEEYLRGEPPGRRVINRDDPAIATLLDRPRSGDLSYGLGDEAQVRAADPRLSFAETAFTLVTPEGEAEVELPLVGRHNLLNALAAAAATTALGISLDDTAVGLAAARPLPGRLEAVNAGTPFPVLVDYAHTPHALEQVLIALREVGHRRLIVVFGCGGDKDRGKRAPMGEIAGRLADVPIVTSDNPRSEDPQAIIDAVMQGVRAAANPRALPIPDRREAIAAALRLADASSVVLIAGKGHEQEQVFADRTVPFDDREVVREVAYRRKT